jgi:tetratricopeptide (TPR) repeat protein
MGMVFIRLHNYEEAAFVEKEHPALWMAVAQYTTLVNGLPYQLYQPSGPDDFYGRFNHAVCLHYGTQENPPSLEQLMDAYEQAILMATEPVQQAYTVVQMATVLTDSGMAENAVEVITRALQQPGLDTHALHALKWQRCQAWLQLLQVPYDMPMLEQLKNELWEVLQYFETFHRTTEQGLLLVEAAHIANISESFAEALGYINRAITFLEQDGYPELVANAQLKKGILLYTWAQKAQPQFYRPAKDALLAALQVFTRETAPDVFADIHHYLGIIYSEIPDEVQKKSVWAGVSVSSFQEALQFFNKVDYPYEFAQICNHFGNAFTKYPAAALGDNFEKALNWYKEALDVRTAEAYPLERCLTLSNYLDAAWKAGNPGDGYSEGRWNDMWEKAQELKALSTDEGLRKEAQGWLDALVKVKAE